MPGGPIIIIDPKTGEQLTFNSWGEVLSYANQQNGQPAAPDGGDPEDPRA